MTPETGWIQPRESGGQHRGPTRNVQPPILILQPCVDHEFLCLHRLAATAYRTPVRRERRFRPVDRFAYVLSTTEFERQLLPTHRRTRERTVVTLPRLVDIRWSHRLLPEGDAIRASQLPQFVVIDIRGRSSVHRQSLELWAGPVFPNDP